jgi:hypothetical protein
MSSISLEVQADDVAEPRMRLDPSGGLQQQLSLQLPWHCLTKMPQLYLVQRIHDRGRGRDYDLHNPIHPKIHQKTHRNVGACDICNKLYKGVSTQGQG